MTFRDAVVAPMSESTSWKNSDRDQASLPNESWKQAQGTKEHAAPLLALPPDLTFAHLPEPIYYDSARRLLLYRGLMSNGSYLHLRRMSDDLHYQLALEELYLASSTPESSNRWPIVVGIAVLVLAIAGIMAWGLLR